MKIKYLVLVFALSAIEANADSSTLDAAIGGGIGGATGAVLGNEVGGRDGAIIGGAIGAGVGAAIATDGEGQADRDRRYYEEYGHYEVKYEPLQQRGQPRIPPGHMPPPGKCRVWYPGTPPGHQPPPGDCRILRHRMPGGAWLVRG